MPLILGANSTTGGYNVDNSLRFNRSDSPYLSRSLSSTSTTWTYSTWVKRSTLGNGNVSTTNYLISWGSSGTDATGINFTRDNNLAYYSEDSPDNIFIETDGLYRDVSAWYHVVVECDATNITIYVNGVSVKTGINANPLDTSTMNIGKWVTSAYYHDGYMAEVVFIEGTALDPTSFGEFDEDSGIWKPIDVSGLTFGTNGFYLDFKDSSALGNDVSGNNNDFTVYNLTAIDQSTDTCTNNFATYNSIFGMGRQDQLTYSEGNTVVVSGATSGFDTTAVSTFAFDSGKWYAEFKLTSDADGAYVGVATSNLNFTNSGIDTSGNSNCWITRGDDGTVRNNGSTAYFGTSFSNNDIIQIAIDMDNSKIWWGLNGTYGNSGNPATGANSAYSNLSGELMIIVGDNFSSRTPTIKANFGSPAFSISSGNSDADGHGNFEYAVPSGYFALCTKNLAEYG